MWNQNSKLVSQPISLQRVGQAVCEERRRTSLRETVLEPCSVRILAIHRWGPQEDIGRIEAMTAWQINVFFVGKLLVRIVYMK